MINAADMAVGLKVTVEGLGTLTLVEPVAACPHTSEAPVEVDFPETSEFFNADGFVTRPARPARKEWVQAERHVRTAVRGGKRAIAMAGSKALDPVERWSALDEQGVLRIVDCHLCELAP